MCDLILFIKIYCDRSNSLQEYKKKYEVYEARISPLPFFLKKLSSEALEMLKQWKSEIFQDEQKVSLTFFISITFQ